MVILLCYHAICSLNYLLYFSVGLESDGFIDDMSLFSFDCSMVNDDIDADHPFHSFDEGSSLTHSINTTNKSKRKRIYKKRPYKRRPQNGIIRPPKRDVRRLYAFMFANVFNAADYSLWLGFFDDFYRKDLSFTQSTQPHSARHPFAPRHISVTGSAQAAQFMFNRLASCPDITMHIDHTELQCKLDGSDECCISCNFRLTGTKVYQLPLHTVVGELETGAADCAVPAGVQSTLEIHTLTETNYSSDNTLVCGDRTSVGSNDFNSCRRIPKNSQEKVKKLANCHSFEVEYESQSGSKGKLLGYSVDKYQELINGSKLLDKPLAISLAGTFTMHLNANKQVTKFDISTSFGKGHNEFKGVL